MSSVTKKALGERTEMAEKEKTEKKRGRYALLGV